MDQDAGFDQFDIGLEDFFQGRIGGDVRIAIFIKEAGTGGLHHHRQQVRLSSGREERFACFFEDNLAQFNVLVPGDVGEISDRETGFCEDVGAQGMDDSTIVKRHAIVFAIDDRISDFGGTELGEINAQAGDINKRVREADNILLESIVLHQENVRQGAEVIRG